MVVAYDARSLHPKWRHWGVGVLVSNLVKRLDGKVDLVGLAPQSTNGAPENIRYWSSPVRKLDVFIFEASPMLAGRYDLYWGTNHALPQLAHGRTLLTVHDLLLFKFPSDQPWTRYARARVSSSIKRADSVVTVSKTTADDLIALFPDITKKVEVIYNGFQAPEMSGDSWQQQIGEPYAVLLGAHRPRKNLELALEAVARARERGAHMRLVVTGDVHPVFKTALQGAGRFTDVVGTLPKEEMFRLLSGAIALLFPSLYEGFGFPLLEAMAVGCPVIALDTPINREIAGEAAAFAPDCPNEWMRLLEVVNDPSARSELKAKGIQNLRRFDWDTSAARYLELMNECAR